jgi:hypothetical protein
MIGIDSVLVPADGYCVREVGGETILLAATGEAIHVLDEVGTFIWRQIDGRRSLDEIVEQLCADYEVDRSTAVADLVSFAGELHALGLVSSSSSPGSEDAVDGTRP